MTIDSARPHELADWWAAALEWEVEPSDADAIRRLVAGGHADEPETMTYRDRLVWRVGTAIRNPEPDAGTPRVLFQLVPEPKTVKNRVHLDVRVPDRVAAVDRLVAAGATVLHEGRQGPVWTTLADPEGNEFCVG